jgi:RimJ/RimL family protein N-acetyltransferase
MQKLQPVRIRLESGEELEIREAVAKDAADLLRFLDAISGESDNLTFGPGEFFITLDQEEEYLAAQQRRSNAIHLLGLIDQKIVATLSFAGGGRQRIKHTGEFGMSVLKEHWNKGIGTTMLSTFLTWCRGTKEIRKVNLRVRVDNRAAIHLYEKMGFKHEGRISREFQIEGQFFDTFCMGLEID